MGLCVGRTFCRLHRGELVDLISVVKATLTVYVVVIVILILRMHVASYIPRIGHSHSLCVGTVSVRRGKSADSGSSGNYVSLAITGRYFGTLAIPRTMAVISAKNEVHVSMPTKGVVAISGLRASSAF